MKKNHWYKVGNQSLTVYARNAGFDFAIYDEYSDEVKTELRKRTVTEAMRSIEWACQEHGFDLPGLKGGVYVISLANPLSLLYPGGRSQVLYIGRGNVHGRIKAHFEHKLFDFMLSVSGADFDFHFAKPARAGTADYFHQVEHEMLEWFSDQYKGVDEKRRYPILNKIAGNNLGYSPSATDWWKKPIKASGRRPLWEMRPTDFSDFTSLD